MPIRDHWSHYSQQIPLVKKCISTPSQWCLEIITEALSDVKKVMQWASTRTTFLFVNSNKQGWNLKEIRSGWMGICHEWGLVLRSTRKVIVFVSQEFTLHSEDHLWLQWAINKDYSIQRGKKHQNIHSFRKEIMRSCFIRKLEFNLNFEGGQNHLL
jgi:hypothetical protein